MRTACTPKMCTMSRSVVVCFVLATILVHCYCEKYETTINGESGPKSELCSEKACIRKCCSEHSLAKMKDAGANSGTCISKKKAKVTRNLTDFNIYTINRELTNKSAASTFVYLKGWVVIRVAFIYDEFLLIEDGTLMLEHPHMYPLWTVYDNDKFCIDDVILFPGGEIVPRAFVLTLQDEERNHVVTIVTMLISSGFLVATLTVYCLLPKLRNLHGKVLMAYAASYLVFFLTQSIYQLVYEIKGSVASSVCQVLALPAYYFLLATFFWMNIMSFDIWWKFRGIVRSRLINRRGERHTFLMYCIYGFGSPLGMTVMFAILNYLPLEYIDKAVVTPGIISKGCFLGGMERLFYLYIPMAVLITANFIMFVATVLNICALKRDAKAVGGSKSDAQRKREKKQFWVFVKIFCLMGVSWMLEITSAVNPHMVFWYFTDAYNTLMGVVIFMIFVGKKNILRLVSKRKQTERSFGQTSSRANNSTEQSDDGSDQGKVCSLPAYHNINPLQPTK